LEEAFRPAGQTARSWGPNPEQTGQL